MKLKPGRDTDHYRYLLQGDEGDTMPMLGTIRSMLNRAQIRLSQEIDLSGVEEKYKESIAKRLGVPPEAIEEERAENWSKAWASSFLKPEWQKKLVASQTVDMEVVRRKRGV